MKINIFLLMIACSFFSCDDRSVKSNYTYEIILEEDFLDKDQIAANWKVVPSESILFKIIKNRNAIVHKVNNDENIWEVLKRDIPKFSIEQQEKLLIFFSSYSDIMYASPEFAKPELALMHRNDKMPFGHDNTVELSRHYVIGNNKYIRPSVDNDDRTNFIWENKKSGWDSNYAIYFSHKDKTIVSVYDGVKWLNKEIDHTLKEYNQIQVSLPKSLKRNEKHILKTEDPIMAITELRVIKTHKCDFDWNGKLDLQDNKIWIKKKNKLKKYGLRCRQLYVNKGKSYPQYFYTKNNGALELKK